MNDGNTPLLLAAQEGQNACVQLLLAARAVVKQANHSGMTPLLIAAENRQTECVKLLLSDGYGMIL